MSTPHRRFLGRPVPRVIVLGTAGTVSVLGLAGLNSGGGDPATVRQAAQTVVTPPGRPADRPSGQRVSQPGWRVVDVTSASDYPGDRLLDVATLGSREAWAVGTTGGDAPLIRRWDGNSWRTVTAPPLPGGGRSGVLRKVVASSPTDVWIFGDRRVAGLIGPSGFALHWNGASWRTTDFGGGTVGDAVASGPGQVWVVGERSTRTRSLLPFARHFDGKSWKRAAIPGGAWALGARSARDVWAVGQSTGRAPHATVAHWNGRKWRAMPAPRPALRKGLRYRISALHARGARNVWATLTLSDAARGDAPAGSLLTHWNGRAWTQARLVLRRDTVFDLTPDGRGGLWLLSFVGPGRTDLLHYAKGRVTRQRTPAKPGTRGDLQSLAPVPGTGAVWAAGDLVRRNHTVAAIYKYGS